MCPFLMPTINIPTWVFLIFEAILLLFEKNAKKKSLNIRQNELLMLGILR